MARYFPGANGNYLQVPTDVAPLDITGTALTICAWVRPEILTGTRWIASKENASVTQSQYRLTGASVIEAIICDGTSFDQAVGATSMRVGSWYHAAMRKNGTGAGALQVFLNGVSDGSATSNRSIQNTALLFTIGNRAANDTPFFGSIAELGVWNFALSDAQIASLAVVGARPPDVQNGNLQGYFPLCGDTLPEPDLAKGNTAAQTGTVAASGHPFLSSPCNDYPGPAPGLGRGNAW